MSSFFVMIPVADGPVFEKGDIVTALQDQSDFGSKVNDDPRFKFVEVENVTLDEAESLVLPLAIYSNNGDLSQQLKQRMLTVDVDKLTNRGVVTKEYFMSLITRKEVAGDIQDGEIAG